jgi:hypothetical protein
MVSSLRGISKVARDGRIDRSRSLRRQLTDLMELQHHARHRFASGDISGESSFGAKAPGKTAGPEIEAGPRLEIDVE